MSWDDYQECDCGRGYFDPDEYRSCYTCYLERRECYMSCIWCGRWHSPKYNTCFQCRAESPERDEAARDLRLDILIRDDFTCQNCGSRDEPQVDHIEPCAKGGSAVPWNLQVLCRECNKLKGANYDWRWEQRRFRLMHLYFTFGWSLLSDEQHTWLVDDAAWHPNEFAWHAHYQELSDITTDIITTLPPQWALDMADAEIPTHCTLCGSELLDPYPLDNLCRECRLIATNDRIHPTEEVHNR
jgi:5-methylcytosine-specific restriction endonuclease McrA